MGVFTLKYRDTYPILEVVLKNPDRSVHDLTGTTAWKLHIRVSATLVLTRDMVKEGADIAGTLRYAWASTDWAPGVLPEPLDSGYLIRDLRMEYEVFSGPAHMTFPNGGYDTLRIVTDLA